VPWLAQAWRPRGTPAVGEAHRRGGGAPLSRRRRSCPFSPHARHEMQEPAWFLGLCCDRLLGFWEVFRLTREVPRLREGGSSVGWRSLRCRCRTVRKPQTCRIPPHSPISRLMYLPLGLRCDSGTGRLRVQGGGVLVQQSPSAPTGVVTVVSAPPSPAACPPVANCERVGTSRATNKRRR
jgi:hypothetical protein